MINKKMKKYTITGKLVTVGDDKEGSFIEIEMDGKLGIFHMRTTRAFCSNVVKWLYKSVEFDLKNKSLMLAEQIG